jgi:DNA adenine methylase
MRYLGGKNRIRKEISTYLESIRKPGQVYFEPFVGGAWVLQEMEDPRIASDGCDPLITMYKELQNGWVPPDTITKEDYYCWKDSYDIDPMKAFVGFGCSHSGKYFNGFARSNTRNYCLNAKNSLLKQLPLIKNVTFIYGTFDTHSPENYLIYCDPPYQNTTKYGYFKSFNYDLFWNTVRKWSKHNTVVISEYSAPKDFTEVLSIPTKTDMRTDNNHRTEKLFRLL